MLAENHFDNFDKATIFWREIELGVLKKEFAVHLQGARWGKVLDLGCGEGEVAKAVFGVHLQGARLEWGLDNDEEMVRKARKNGIYKKVLLADAGEIPLKDGSVGLVFSNSVLEHIKDLDGVLREVVRVLKPGGKLVFTAPTKWLGEYLGWGRLYAKVFNWKYNHYHLYDLPRWKKILGKHGLEVVEGRYYLNREEVKHWHRLLWRGKNPVPNWVFGPRAQYPMKNASEPSLVGLAIVARKARIK